MLRSPPTPGGTRSITRPTIRPRSCARSRAASVFPPCQASRTVTRRSCPTGHARWAISRTRWTC